MTERHVRKANLKDICYIEDALADCTWFNAASPYMAARLPLSPGQTSQVLPWLRDPDHPDHAVAWRLRPDEAVVLVGFTLQPVRYFGVQTYRWFTTDEEGNRVRRWNYFGDQTNQLTISTAGTPNGTQGNPYNNLTVRITTTDHGIDAQVREAAPRADFPDVDKLYAYKFAREYGDDEEFCLQGPYGWCNYQGTEQCIGKPGCAGMASVEKGKVVWRAYLHPASKTGLDPAEVILDKAIKFSPED